MTGESPLASVLLMPRNASGGLVLQLRQRLPNSSSDLMSGRHVNMC